MKSREFGVWPPRNGFGVERQKLYDEHNRSFKRERPSQPKEYASIDVEEYYRVPETKDVSGNPYEENDGSLSKSKKDRNSKSRNRLKAIQQVAVLAVGAVLVATSYQAAAKQQNDQKPSADVMPSDSTSSDTSNSGNTDTKPEAFIVNWSWSDDKSSVVLELYDTSGILIKELPAVIIITEEAATCNKEGLRTYTATVKDEDTEYSDAQTEVIAPLGHDFDSGTEVVLQNGHKAITFECSRCHEKFTVETSMTEN